MELTVQIHFDQAWHDAATLVLPSPDRGVPARILDMPAVGLHTLNDRLRRWGLL